LRLRIAIAGVKYHRVGDDNSQAGVSVVVEASFVLPERRVLEYAKLPVTSRAEANTALQLEVEALTPSGDEIVCLTAYSAEITHNMSPELELEVLANKGRVAGMGKNTKISKDNVHDHFQVTGHRGMGSWSHWEFRNDSLLQDPRYPSQVFLLITFSSAHPDDSAFPFLLRFKSDCQITFGDKILNVCRHAIGRPQRIDFNINGRYKESLVEDFQQKKQIGLVAAMGKHIPGGCPSK